jgi:hypothetical protein
VLLGPRDDKRAWQVLRKLAVAGWARLRPLGTASGGGGGEVQVPLALLRWAKHQCQERLGKLLVQTVRYPVGWLSEMGDLDNLRRRVLLAIFGAARIARNRSGNQAQALQAIGEAADVAKDEDAEFSEVEEKLKQLEEFAEDLGSP